jgi:hypothetical protein
MGLALATAAFWLFLAVVIGSLIWRKGLQRREVLITLRMAIEKGLPLDDERLQALLGAATGNRTNQISHDFFLVFGAILAAGGLCLVILAFFGAEAAPLVAIALCAGVMATTCFVLWRIFAQRAKRTGKDPQ